MRKLADDLREMANDILGTDAETVGSKMEEAANTLERWAPIVERAMEVKVSTAQGGRIYQCRLCGKDSLWHRSYKNLHAPDCPLREPDHGE